MKLKRKAVQKPYRSSAFSAATQGSVVVPIYRNRVRNGVAYIVAWKEGGKRRKKAFADIERARGHAAEMADILAQYGASTLTLTGEDRISYLRAVDLLKPLGMSVDTAIAEFVTIKAAGPKPPEECPKVAAIVADMLAAKEGAGRSDLHVRDLRNRLRRFAEAFPATLLDVHAADVGKWASALPVGHRSRRNYLGAVSSLIRFAEHQGYIPRGSIDLSGIERGESHTEVAIFTPQELRQLLDACRPDMVPFVALGAFAGLRTAEIRRLTWEEVGPEYIDIRARKAKTRQRRLVPVLPVLAAWLAPHRGSGDICPLVEPWDELRKTSARSGVKWKLNGLRHSFGTYRLALVKSESQVALEMGNSPAMVFAHYRAITTEAQAAEWFGVGPPELTFEPPP